MAAIASPQRPPSQDAGLHLIRELNLSGERQYGYPTPPTGHGLMEMWPTLAPQLPRSSGSSFFHSQERAFFSRDNSFFRIQIEVDVSHTTQTLGGPHRQEKGKYAGQSAQKINLLALHVTRQHLARNPAIINHVARNTVSHVARAVHSSHRYPDLPWGRFPGWGWAKPRVGSLWLFFNSI